MTTLIAGVGYQNMRDTSLGSLLIPQLARLDWPPDVELLDMFFGPVHAVHWLEEQPNHYQRIVFVSSVERGHAPGQITSYCWDGALPEPAEIHERVCEAVTGLVSLDNMLIVCQHFGVLPPDVRVVEVEPEETTWGIDLSPRIEARLPDVIAAVRKAALAEQFGHHQDTKDTKEYTS